MDYMEQALSLARLASGQVSPNPAVGAMVVKDGKVVGRGFTQLPGSHHAEIIALRQAGEAARGSVMYVTLEPCCHYGRTPPCTQAIIDAGVSEVHLALLDANPLVAGKGNENLICEGIKTYLGEHEEEARNINEAYIKFITTGLPFITVKFAMSLDGKIATHSGDSQWISGVESRKYVHSLRCASDSVMVGANTVLRDNPRLTARCGGKGGGIPQKQPLRVIVDGRGRTPQTARMFAEPGDTLLVLGRAADIKEKESFARARAEIMEMPQNDNSVNLVKLVQVLGSRGITSVLVEGGGILLGSLFDGGFVDKVVAFIAPVIIGGAEAKTAIAGKGIGKMVDSLKLKHITVNRMGDDIMVSGYIREY
ncbi:bifunctional diaminohydroxyphosphoribosylaminopyrimidine deaminase/5-amino-6-(5-phosphoribosylamino)uracil reductase RibD [Chloroflexota bacterium]